MRETRERLGIPEDGDADDGMISLAKAAEHLHSCVGCAKRLIGAVPYKVHTVLTLDERGAFAILTGTRRAKVR